MRNDRIRIANPIAAGQKFTSRARALMFVRRGEAEWIGPNVIRFSLDTQYKRELELDREMKRNNRSGQYRWQGPKPNAPIDYRPGEVIS
jgi:hypothetical protein